MKNKFISIFVAAMLLLGVLLAPLAHALNATITNPTLTEAAAGQPVGWQPDAWGNNTPNFSYLSTGQNDTASVEVTMTNYVDGDAKWRFDPVSVTAGQKYVFTDYYRSDVATNLWAQYADSAGAVNYVWLGSVAAAATWTPASVTFTVPAGKTAISIFHVLNTNGYLDTDSFSLVAQTTPVCNPTLANGLYNGSFAESCDGGVSPARWTHAIYGSNKATFAYLNSGYDNSRSVQTKITGYTGGEAGWFTTPQSAIANQRYRFTGHVKSTTYSYAYVEIQLSDGSYAYVSLMSVPSTNSEWSTYDDVFVTPANTSTISIHFAISSLGSLTMDAFQLAALKNYSDNKLASPLVSINFDDGYTDAFTAALPVLNNLNVKASFYVNGSNIGTTGYMTGTQISKLSTQGHEIGSHSLHHYDLVPLSASTLSTEINQNQTKIASITGKAPTTFATPFGSFNSRVLDKITATVPYVRDTDNAINYKYSFNARTIHAKDVTSTMTIADIDSLLQRTQQQGGWLVLVYHNIAPSGDQYTVSQATLKQQLQEIQKYNIPMVTNAGAIAQITPQL